MAPAKVRQVRYGHLKNGVVLASEVISTYLARLRARQRQAEAGVADFDDPDLGG
jgi:hypothetical protein